MLLFRGISKKKDKEEEETGSLNIFKELNQQTKI